MHIAILSRDTEINEYSESIHTDMLKALLSIKVHGAGTEFTLHMLHVRRRFLSAPLIVHYPCQLSTEISRNIIVNFFITQAEAFVLSAAEIRR